MTLTATIKTTLPALADSYLGKGKTGRAKLDVTFKAWTNGKDKTFTHIYRGYGRIFLEDHTGSNKTPRKGSFCSEYSEPMSSTEIHLILD